MDFDILSFPQTNRAENQRIFETKIYTPAKSYHEYPKSLKIQWNVPFPNRHSDIYIIYIYTWSILNFQGIDL